MIKKSFLTILFSLIATFLFAQQYILEGKVTNTKLEPVAYVTVQLKSQQVGTRTDENGQYKFKLEEGDYDLVFSLVGYKTKIQKVIVRKNGTVQNIILESNTKDINEVKITANKKDKAEEYIKNVIRTKEENQQKASTFSCNAYIKATEINTTNTTKKSNKDTITLSDSLMTKKINDSIRKEMNSMSMAEIYMRIDYEYPNKIKEERTGVKKRGNTANLFYLTTTEGNFSLYENLIKVPALTQTPMLSPISYSGLVAYKFKTLKVDKKSNFTLYTIRFNPIKSGNALIEGEVVIVDTSWSIIDAKYSFPSHLLAEYDKFNVILSYEMMQQKAWMLDRMELNYFSKMGKSKNTGSTIVVYDEYKIDTTFKKKYFSTEVSSTSLEAYERDSTFWNTVRKEPLSDKELQYIHYKDSVFDFTHTKKYLDSLDKKNNKITVKDIFVNGISFYKRATERTLYLYPLSGIYRFLYPGGPRIAYGGYYGITPKNKRTILLNLDLAYGGKKRDFVGFLTGSYRYNPFLNGYIGGSIGRNYDLIFKNDSYINILRRTNFYKRNYIEFSHSIEILNGLVLKNKIEFAARFPLSFTNNDTLIDKWLGNNGANTNAYNVFQPYNAFYNSITLEYTPKQMYMREPRQKVILGSKFPTIYATWRKGIPNVFKSVIDFDYVEFGIKQRLKLGLLGISEYAIYTGNFLSKKNLQTIDYKFIRRGDPILFTSPQYNFQLLDSTFPIFKQFYEGHYIHEFYGALINKIPYVKKLKLYEVAGGGALYAPERKLIYFETYAGLEKPFKLFNEKMKIGFYFVSSIANKQNKPYQFKIGLQNYDIVRNRWQ